MQVTRPESENWTQRWHELFPLEVMLEAGRKYGMSYSRELDSRYNYLGMSCSLMYNA